MLYGDIFAIDGCSRDTIIKWEAEMAPNECQYPLTDEDRMRNVYDGYSYCNGVGWVNLINRIDD